MRSFQSCYIFLSGIDWQVKLESGADSGGRFNRSLANLLLLRGRDVDTVDNSVFTDPDLYTSWMPPQYSLLTGRQPRLFSQYEKCATLVTNSGSPLVSLNHMVDKAWNMFSSRAYVHQYFKHGLTDEDFLDGFVTLEQVISSYKKL